MNGKQRARVLGALQDDLEAIYGVTAPLAVGDVALDREVWRRLSSSGVSEELVVVEADDSLEIGLFVDDAVVHELSRPHRGWTHNRLSAHCQAVEGVSHFLYVSHRAQQNRPVSHLELELQAEIDKFVTVVLALWRAGRKEAAGELRHRLFESVSFHEHLDSQQRETYQKANGLAHLYCRFLENRYVMRNSIEGLFGDLRRMYRLGAAEKLSHAACGSAF